MKSSWRMRAVAAGVLVLAAGSSACYGPFNATRQVWAWNRDISENKWAQEGMFLVLAIIPVYGFASIADALIFNSIEFWTGDNPIDSPGMAKADVRSFEQDGRTVTLARSEEASGRQMTITVEENGCVTQEFRFVAEGEGATRVLDASGSVIAQATTRPDGSVEVTDPAGVLIGTF